MKVEVPAWEWYGWKPEGLTLNDQWDVHEKRMTGHRARPLSLIEIKEHLQMPVGAPTLSKLARGRRKCCIIFDDMTRPTKTHQVLPSLLEELKAGGLTDDQIVFIMATGAHVGRLLGDFQKKLGEEIPEKYLVFNHTCYENTVNLGKTEYGTPVHVNREVMSCDLKVTVGAIMPHFGFGFGGGSKMILPGVAGIDTITHNHNIREGTGPGIVDKNIRRLDSEEAARMVGVDFVVNALLNADCDASHLVCGDLVEAHRSGVEKARTHYSTEVVADADIVITNGYPMANEGYKAHRIAEESVRKGGDLVFLLFTPEGCRVHHYNGRFGSNYGGRGWRPDVYVKEPWKMDRIICHSPKLALADEFYYGPGSVWVKTWDEVRALLEKKNIEEVKVAIYPTAVMQISEEKAAQR